MDIKLISIKPATDAWTQQRGSTPRREGLYWILYISSNSLRLAYWREGGPWGRGWYCPTQLHTPESEIRDVFRIEPAKYAEPDQYQPVDGEHSITFK